MDNVDLLFIEKPNSLIKRKEENPMKLKVLIGSALSAAMLCLTPATQAAAAETCSIVSPLYEIADEAQSSLRINGSTATCQSTVTNSSAVKITAEQTLQKQGFLWSWGTYDGAKWTKTVNVSTISMSNTKTGLSSGKYRLKTVFTLTDKNGKSEAITVYSDSKTVS